MSESAVATSTTIGKHIGKVKWFNNKKGFGFITVVSDEQNGKDVFVHQSNVIPVTSTYRTLSIGEYVSLDISEDDKEQAVHVTGVYGGELQCDVRLEKSRHGHNQGQGHDDTGHHN
jgi:cold shock protein